MITFLLVLTAFLATLAFLFHVNGRDVGARRLCWTALGVLAVAALLT
jgi:hypothetical protein